MATRKKTPPKKAPKAIYLDKSVTREFATEDYIPFGQEWEAELMKQPKSMILQLLRVAGMEKAQQERRLEDLRKSLEIQGAHGNWNYDAYMFGMFNGMEFAAATLEGRAVQYKDKPEHFLVERKAEGQVNYQAVAPSPKDIVAKFIESVSGREDIFPELLRLINDRLMWKLKHDAELLSERTAVARKRMEDGLSTVQALFQGYSIK